MNASNKSEETGENVDIRNLDDLLIHLWHGSFRGRMILPESMGLSVGQVAPPSSTMPGYMDPFVPEKVYTGAFPVCVGESALSFTLSISDDSYRVFPGQAYRRDGGIAIPRWGSKIVGEVLLRLVHLNAQPAEIPALLEKRKPKPGEPETFYHELPKPTVRLPASP